MNEAKGCCGPSFNYAVRARTFYLNDQRLRFTGNEATFAAEAQLDVSAWHQIDQWQVGLIGELYFTQPFDRNILADYPLRESFRNNFLIEPLELSQLFITARNGDWTIEAGRIVTPFGKYWAEYKLNARTDVPFIRSESILFRETGILIRRRIAAWNFAAALTNGGLDRDTNSSKAFIGRVAYEIPEYVIGASVKWHDGVGSESQKEFNRHVGFDVMRRVSDNWLISGEIIYDEYGLRRPGTPLDHIDWGRSIYNRQLNAGLNVPLRGVGFYVNAVGEFGRWQTVLGYGEFHPRAIGDRIHDATTRRLLTKCNYLFDEHLQLFGSMILENFVENAQASVDRRGVFAVLGAEYRF